MGQKLDRSSRPEGYRWASVAQAAR